MRSLHYEYFSEPIPYDRARTWQQSLAEERYQNPEREDVLLLLQHPPVYTLGRGADVTFLKFNPDRAPYEVYRVERGGEVTYHAPGQLVGYPILNLHRYRTDLHWYLRQLEEMLIQVLAEFGLNGDRVEGLTGVWIGDAKIAAIGIQARRWITTHGFALNVCPDLSGFDRIVPCGIRDRGVTSMAQFIPHISIDGVYPIVVEKFAEVFGIDNLCRNSDAIADNLNYSQCDRPTTSDSGSIKNANSMRSSGIPNATNSS